MALTKTGYKTRFADEKLSVYLKLFGAVIIEGPKWCGKTWTALNHAESVTYMTEKSSRDLADADPKYIFTGKSPQLIDEWQVVPPIWDSVRHECDSDGRKGKFILTGSTTLSGDDGDKKVFHTGTGRIASVRMETMSLYESGNSSGRASITDMYNGTLTGGYERKVELDELASYLIRGGWPDNIGTSERYMHVMPANYLNAVIEKDIHERNDHKRDSNKMRMLIRSLARNECTVVSNNTIIKDIEENAGGSDYIKNRETVADYLGVLDDLFLTANQTAFSVNYRSSDRIGKSPKRHLADPSLACAALGLTADKLMHDHETFGLLFESLVERDLRIYMEYLGGRLYHFRDNKSGDEVDAITEFENGDYAAIEVKLTESGIEDAKKSLLKFYENAARKPKFMCIIVGHYEAVVKDPETGIYIAPITSLKP